MKNTNIKTIADMNGLSMNVAFLNLFDGLSESQYSLFSKFEDVGCLPIVLDRLGISPENLRDLDKKKIDVLVLDTRNMTFDLIKGVLDEFAGLRYLPKHVIFTGGDITHPAPLMYDLNHPNIGFHMFDELTKELTPIGYGKTYRATA